MAFFFHILAPTSPSNLSAVNSNSWFSRSQPISKRLCLPLLLSFCVSCYAPENLQIGKAVEKCFLCSVCSALSGPANPALSSYSQTKDLLIQTTPPSPRAEICHSFCVMPFDLSFSERNQVWSAFYLVVVRVRPGP